MSISAVPKRKRLPEKEFENSCPVYIFVTGNESLNTVTRINSNKAAKKPVAARHKRKVYALIPSAFISGKSCTATLIPPNPQRNAATIMFFFSAANCTPAVTSDMSLTASFTPVGKKEPERAETDEKTIMNEQTEITAAVLFSTAARNASDKVICSAASAFFAFVFPYITFNIIPITAFAVRHEKNSVIPAVADEKNAPHTVIVKDSPGLTAIRHIRFASSAEISFCAYMSPAFFTPTGYPPVSPNSIHTALFPDSPKKNFDGTDTARTSGAGKPCSKRVLLITITGKTDGIIIFAQSDREFIAPFFICAEKTNVSAYTADSIKASASAFVSRAALFFKYVILHYIYRGVIL